jgi:hypothetical protein
MKKTSGTTSIPNLIGVLLVIVALVSAGGLYYTASVYARISDTYVSVESAITGMSVSYNNLTQTVDVTVTVLIDNPTSLDIQVYRVEYMSYMDKDPSSIFNYNRYTGSGSTSERNNTVKAESVREMQVSFKITSENTYFDRVLYAMEDGPSLYFLVDGTVWFQVADYGQVKNQIGIFAMDYVEVDSV